MAYGIEVKNAGSEIVIDDLYPAVFLSASATRTGTAFTNPPGVSQIASFRYPRDNSKIQFANLGVGDFLIKARYGDYFHSNKSSLQFRDAVLSSTLPAPTGYGVAVYNTSGELCFTAGNDLIPIRDEVELVQAGTLVNESGSWVCIAETPIRFVAPQAGFAYVQSSGVKRVNSTQYEYMSYVTQLGPPINYNSGGPVTALIS